jgi:hypothetical protein
MGNNKTRIFITVLCMLFFFTGVSQTTISADGVNDKQDVKKKANQQKNPYANAEISIKIIPSIEKTFGYDILIQGRPLVHQPNIPGLPGHKGFTTRKRAKKIAEFVMKKIKKNEMPPTVTMDDLSKMDVLK